MYGISLYLVQPEGAGSVQKDGRNSQAIPSMLENAAPNPLRPMPTFNASAESSLPKMESKGVELRGWMDRNSRASDFSVGDQSLSPVRDSKCTLLLLVTVLVVHNHNFDHTIS